MGIASPRINKYFRSCIKQSTYENSKNIFSDVPF